MEDEQDKHFKIRVEFIILKILIYVLIGIGTDSLKYIYILNDFPFANLSGESAKMYLIF